MLLIPTYLIFSRNMNNPQPKSFNPTNPNPKHNLTDNGISRPTAPSFSNSDCSNCNSNKSWFLHNVRIRGVFRRLCTCCVLRLHASSFCPSCFQLHEPTNILSSTNRLTCSKCSSFTHSHCAPSSAYPSSSSSYLCPPCASPNFTFFDIDYDPNIRIMEKRHALAFYCATKIASASMSKSKVVAASEAERRAREAAVARKRARESLEQLAAVVQARRSVGVSGSVAKLGLDKDVKKKLPLSVIDGSSNKKMNNENAIALDRSSIHGNGNVNEKEKEKSGDVSKPEEIDITKMDINQKSTHGSQENVASK